jgi:hypothetical protein
MPPTIATLIRLSLTEPVRSSARQIADPVTALPDSQKLDQVVSRNTWLSAWHHLRGLTEKLVGLRPDRDSLFARSRW